MAENGPPKIKEENREERESKPSRFSGGGPSNRFSGGSRRGGPDGDDRGPPDLMSADHSRQDDVGNRGGVMRRGGRGGRGGSSSGFNRGGSTGHGRVGGGLPGNDRGGPSSQREEMNRARTDDRVNDKLLTMGGATYELPYKEPSEKQFSSRCRLYVGNLSDCTEEEIKELFKPYGEIHELFFNPEKMFAFVRLDYRTTAEKAKRELDGCMVKNKPIKVRFAPVGAAIKVKNLSQWVTNELLEYGFSIFGDIESAQVLVDERGNSLREGIVEFSRKPSALNALRRCTEGCFFLTSNLRPVIVEPYDVVDDVDGFSEKSIPRRGPEYLKAREIGPRFASTSSFEHEYGSRWKQLYELFKQKEDALKREMKLEEEKLDAQMEYVRFEHETEMLREQLRQREMDKERQKHEWEMKERQAEEQRLRDDELMRRRHNEQMGGPRGMHPDEELRRRQEFMMGREAGGPSAFGDGNGPPPADQIAIREYEALAAAGNIPADPKAFLDAFERNPRFDGGRGGDEQNARGSRWGQPPLVDEYHHNNKRRRY